jgi:acyl-coenzyme A thioesterase PaaI-like protein
MSVIDVSKLPTMPVRANLGGTVLAVNGETGASRLRYAPGEHLKNSVGTIFGGYLAAIVDDAAGITAWFGGGKRRFATSQLTVNFLRPVRPGDALLAETSITGMNERQVVIDVKLRREGEDKLMVTGTVVQVFLKKNTPAQAAQEETK